MGGGRWVSKYIIIYCMYIRGGESMVQEVGRRGGHRGGCLSH